MDLAKPGLIKEHCQPNALSTYLEYLLDYASPQTRQAGERLIEQALQQMDTLTRRRTEAMLQKVRTGKRDVYC
jgi:2-iminoacetate synthase